MMSRISISLASAVALLGLAAACSFSPPTPDGDDDSPAPTVTAISPGDGSAAVSLSDVIEVTATFSEAMDPSTLTDSTFTLISDVPAELVVGTVVYDGLTVVFIPTAPLASRRTYTATITTVVHSAVDVALAADEIWSFTTGDAPEPPVELGTAATYVILAKTGITTVPTSAITGNLGVSPIVAASITGFALIMDASNQFSRSSQVTGKVFAADYATPTPTLLMTAVTDMELAAANAAARTPAFTEIGAGNIGTMTLPPGVYHWSTALAIPTDVTLRGGPNDVWIFQVAQGMDVTVGARVVLAGGAVAKHVFWQVAGAVTIGGTAHLEGIVLAQTSVTLGSRASLDGRLLAQTAVSLAENRIAAPVL